jgi:hypothetical protein
LVKRRKTNVSRTISVLVFRVLMYPENQSVSGIGLPEFHVHDSALANGSCWLVSAWRSKLSTQASSSHWLARHEHGTRAGLYLTRTDSPDTLVSWRRGQRWSLTLFFWGGCFILFLSLWFLPVWPSHMDYYVLSILIYLVTASSEHVNLVTSETVIHACAVWIFVSRPAETFCVIHWIILYLTAIIL